MQPLATVFFGGGTPSLIPPPLLAQLLDALRDKFGVAADAEISMEADPGRQPGRVEAVDAAFWQQAAVQWSSDWHAPTHCRRYFC